MQGKSQLLIGLAVGLLFGALIGFMGANMLNRGQIAANNEGQAPAPVDRSSLPADHPPVVGGSNATDMSPQIMEAIEKARNNPQDYEAQMTAGDLYYQIQRFDQAVPFYENANKLKPGDVESMVKSGNARFDAEQYVEAAAWYEKVLAQRPNDANVRSDLGLTYYLREPQDIDRAIAEFQKSLAIDPKHEMTLQNLVIAYSTKGDEAAKSRTLERLKQVNPSNPAIAKFSGTETK